VDRQFQQLEIGSNSLSTRPATGQDLDLFASMTSRGKDWVSALSAQLENRNIHILVAEQDDQVVGFIHIRIVKRGIDVVDSRLKRYVKRQLGIYANESDTIIQTVKYGHILEIYVDPQLHNRGIKVALIEACIEWSRSQQVSELQVEINPKEDALISFYRRVGFNDSSFMIQRRLPKKLPPPKEYIRFADQNDLPQLIKLVKNQMTHQQSLTNSFELLQEVNWPQYISSIMKNRSSEIFVADQNGQLVGYFETRIYQRGVYGIKSFIRSLVRRNVFPNKNQAEPFGVMENIFVLPEFRPRGIAQNLILGGANWFRQKGVEEVLGVIWANNESTLKLVNTIGFDTIKVTLSKRI
jgi:ribosomal protein S18 acetylase RimI-like enzyme